MPLRKYLEEEWETEQLDSTLFQLGYVSSEEIKKYKNIFLENFSSFATKQKIKIAAIDKFDMYSGLDLQELKSSTSYMNKNIDYLVERIESSSMEPALFVSKKGVLSILGGRTRASVQRVLGRDEIDAYVIDFKKLSSFCAPLREREFLDDGYGLLSLESRNLRAAFLMEAKYGTPPNLQRIKTKLSGEFEHSDEELLELINDVRNFIYISEDEVHAPSKAISALLQEQSLKHIEKSSATYSEIKEFLNDNPYSPYIQLYGGESALYFDETKSFTALHDKKRRFFLDSEMKINFENFISFDNQIYAAKAIPLSEAISAPFLFKNYPHFKDIKITMNISNDISNDYSYGSFSPSKNEIVVHAANSMVAASTLLHELQHAIQVKEGFALGTNTYDSDDDVMEAVALEERYLNKQGRLDEEAILGDGVDRLPRYFTNYHKFQALFKNKISSKHALLETPIGSVKINMRGAFDHFKNNTHNTDRTRHSGGLIPSFTDPLFVVKDNYNGKDVNVFYKPMVSKRKKEGLMHFVGYAIDSKGNLENSTYFNITKSRLEKYIKTEEKNLLYFKHANVQSLESCPDLSGETRTSDEIIADLKKKVNSSIKEEREKNFKEWFGDSKVVDDKGEPLVVYHGTSADFSEFRAEKARSGWLSKGFYFTKELREAEDYGQRIIEAHVSLENPFVVKGDTVNPDGTVEWAKSTKEQLAEALPHIKDFKMKDASAHLKEMGYDGIVNGQHIIAFTPSQIKSIHNNGRFNKHNPNIMERCGQELKVESHKLLNILPRSIETKELRRFLDFYGIKDISVDSSKISSLKEDIFTLNNIEYIPIDHEKKLGYFNNDGEMEAREVESTYLRVDADVAAMSDGEREAAIEKLTWGGYIKDVGL